MPAWTVLIAFVVVAALALAGASLAERQIQGWIRDRWPSQDISAESGILVGLVAVAAFALGLLLMYVMR